MHETLIDNVKGFVDNYIIKDDNIIINGWCFHLIYNICNIRLNFFIWMIKIHMLKK
jgi:hypothetical protein